MEIAATLNKSFSLKTAQAHLSIRIGLHRHYRDDSFVIVLHSDRECTEVLSCLRENTSNDV